MTAESHVLWLFYTYFPYKMALSFVLTIYKRVDDRWSDSLLSILGGWPSVFFIRLFSYMIPKVHITVFYWMLSHNGFYNQQLFFVKVFKMRLSYLRSLPMCELLCNLHYSTIIYIVLAIIFKSTGIKKHSFVSDAPITTTVQRRSQIVGCSARQNRRVWL